MCCGQIRQLSVKEIVYRFREGILTVEFRHANLILFIFMLSDTQSDGLKNMSLTSRSYSVMKHNGLTQKKTTDFWEIISCIWDWLEQREFENEIYTQT